jgi:hypothetical protein
MPTISPSTPHQPTYTVTGSKAFLANVELDFNTFDVRFFRVIHPTGAAGLTVELRHTGTGTVIGLADGTSDTTVLNRHVTASAAPGTTPGTTELTCNISDTGGAGIVDERWELRVRATSPADWLLDVENSTNFDVLRVLCDPVAAFATAPPPTALEQDAFQVAAANAAGGTVVGSLPGAPSPTPIYTFSHSGAIVISDLPSTPGPSQTLPVTMPGVYGTTPAPMTVSVTVDGVTPDDPSFLQNASPPAPLSIQPRPQQVALVLDRSGSMASEGRWDNAKTAARMLVNLFGEFRNNVHLDDRIGIVTFTDNDCAFHSGPVSDQVKEILPLAKPQDAAAAVCALNLEDPGGCTPIGDGLVKAMQMLAAGGGGSDARYTVILLTDGFENSGTVKVGPPPLPSGVSSFADARTGISEVNNNMRLFVVGFGSSVDEGTLNHLTADARFLLITDPSQLAAGFGEMLSVSQEVRRLVTHPTPPIGGADPAPPVAPATPVYFSTATGAEMLGVATLAATGTVELAVRQGGAFVPQSVGPKSCDQHIHAAVPNVPAFGGAAQEWRIVHIDGGVPQPLGVDQVLAYEDLHVKADVRLDQLAYQTGDEMLLAVRIRHDNLPILDARVRAELDAPEQGLGTLLSSLDHDPRRQDLSDLEGKDIPTSKAAAIEALLKRHGWRQLPRTEPTGLFVDGTDELHDPDGYGNYTNTFARVHKEGVYTWTLFVEGTDTKGNFFDQRMTLSTHASVSIDGETTLVTKQRLLDSPPGLTAVQVTILPMDARKEKLGPGYDDTVIWALTNGQFAHVAQGEPAPVNHDGTYQRTVLFRQADNPRPILTVSVNGTVLPLIDVRHPDGPTDAPAGAAA